MAVKINAVYPPVVESSIPAFAINDTTTNDRTLKVNFTLPMVVNWDDI